MKKKIIIFLKKYFISKLIIDLLSVIKARLSNGRLIIFNRPKNNLPDTNGFLGWGMYTYQYPPWVSNNILSNRFLKAYFYFEEKVKNRNIILSQFEKHLFNKNNSFDNEILYNLKYRHYYVYWSIDYIIKKSQKTNNQFNLAECGVCDGLTMFYALRSLKDSNINNFKSYLYDSWEAIDTSKLTKDEMYMKGKYNYLSLEQTKKNLDDFSENTVFNKGFIPESFYFNENLNPDKLNWLHIDLNSSNATLKTLEFFYDKLLDESIILFDDYGWHGFEETRVTIDNFFSDKAGTLQVLPTGQALYFKKQK